ncbi:(S)-ureidoglycine aminohydrolase, partial [Leucobacter sp. OLES1]
MTSYRVPDTTLPSQRALLTDRAIVTEAYTVIPRGVLRDIVTSVLPEWTGTRSWVINRPVAGGATTFAQYLVEVAPGGGSEHPEPEPEVQSFVFVMAGRLTVRLGDETHVLEPGGFAYLPPGADWSVGNAGEELAWFSWIRKHHEPLAGHEPRARFGNERDFDPDAMPDTDGTWR